MFTQQEFLEQLGSPFSNSVVERLRRFAHIPHALLNQLAHDALTEIWEPNNFGLEKYLSVHVPWSLEQGLFTQSENQFYVAAGHLQTRYGTPLYLVFERNRDSTRQPYYLRHVGSQVSAPELPTPPVIPAPPDLPRGAEVIMMHDHILGDQADRVEFLRTAPPVAQMCAVSGAIQWLINRSLHLPYWYFGKMNYLVPLYCGAERTLPFLRI